MAKPFVTGIGGLFFRAKDPQALASWYREALGIEIGGEALWHQEAGPTVYAPFKSDTDYFPSEKQWMINLRVTDLRALLDHLRGLGIETETREEWDGEYGTFARIHDPEGNPIELWEPPSSGK